MEVGQLDVPLGKFWIVGDERHELFVLLGRRVFFAHRRQQFVEVERRGTIGVHLSSPSAALRRMHSSNISWTRVRRR